MIELYFDGASKNNGSANSRAGCGWYIVNRSIKTEAEVSTGFKFLGNKTNNEAEYSGLIHGLENCRELCTEGVNVFGDSLLIIQQMRGNWKVKAANLKPYWERAQELSKQFKKIEFHHIDRSLNSEADKLANKGVNG